MNRFWITASVLLLALFNAGNVHSAGPQPRTIADLIVTEHPRLMFGTKAWPGGISPEVLAARVDSLPWSPWYAGLDRRDFAGGALDWLIRNHRGEAEGRDRVADSVLARMLALPMQDGYLYNAENLQKMSLAYDWLYGYSGFSEGMKDSLRLKMFALSKALISIDSKTGQEIVGPDIFEGAYSCGALAVGLAGLATYQGFSDTSATRLIKHAVNWYARSFEGMKLLDGGWHGGPWTSLAHVLRETPVWVAALRSSTGADLFTRIKRDQGDWMEGWIYYGLASLRPDWSLVRSGDAPAVGLTPDYLLRPALEIIVSAYRNGHGKYLLDELDSRPGAHALAAADLWLPLIFYDPSIRSMDYRELNPSQFIGPKRLGYVTLRSGWGPDITFVHFECGDYFGRGDHLDRNQFTIFHKGSLALDSGFPDSGPHRDKYTLRSIAHNTVLVRDPLETVPSRSTDSWSSAGGQRALDYSFPAVDFDLLDYWSRYRSGSHADAGDLTAWESCRDYDFVAGDATAAYNSPLVTDPGARPKISRFVRRLLFVKPGLVAVCDNVDSMDPTFGKTWLLHTAAEPQIGPDGTVTVTQGEGQLCLSPLFPEDVRAVKVGGPGREFMVGGVNVPPAEAGIDSVAMAEAGAWRLELTPGAPRMQDLFLNVMQVGDRGSIPAHAFRRVQSPDLVGAASDSLALLFTRDRDPDSPPQKKITLPTGLPAGCRVYLAGLVNGGVYALSSAGTRVTTLAAGSGGVLEFRLAQPQNAGLEWIP